jgi:phosphoglycolate phosphatase
MIPAQDLPALVFDTDGTLIDARSAVVDAVLEGLEQTYGHFGLPRPELDRARACAAMGLPATMYFRVSFDPQTVPADLHDAFAGEFEVRSTRAEVAALHRGASKLYDGVEDTLAVLAERGHPLALYSNATEPYFRAVVEVHRLERFFSRTLSLEHAVRQRLARHKSGMVRHLTRGHEQAVVVGDRIHDIEAGRAASAYLVGCLYGFGDPGELNAADWQINSVAEILELPLAALPAKGVAGVVDAARS